MFSISNQIKSIIDIRIVKNIFWLSADKIFRLLLGLLAGAWVARYLGPFRMGKINYVAAYISIVITVTTLGMDGFLVKEIVENKENKNGILGTAFVLRFSSVAIMFLLNLVLFYFLQVDQETYQIFFLLYFTVVLSPFDLIDLEYQSVLKSKSTVIAKNIGYSVGAILKITAIICKMNLIYFAGILGVESIFAYLLLIFRYQKTDNSIFYWKFEGELVRHFVKTGWPFFLSGLAVVLYMRLDQIMLGNLLSYDKVGEFTAAVRVSEMFLFIPMAIGSSFYPSLVEAKKQLIPTAYYSKVKQLLKLMLIISFSICILVFFFSGIIIQLLNGDQYSNAANILQVYIWSLVAIFLGVAISQYLVIENLQKFNLYRTTIGLLLNVVLNIFLIPHYGGIGAAIATLIAQFTSSVFGNFLFKKTRNSIRLLQ